MRHLLGLLMVMAILAISLIQPEINESIVELNQLAAKSCGPDAPGIDGEDRLDSDVTLDEAWKRCDPAIRSDEMLTSQFVLKFSFD